MPELVYIYYFGFLFSFGRNAGIIKQNKMEMQKRKFVPINTFTTYLIRIRYVFSDPSIHESSWLMSQLSGYIVLG